MRARLHVPPSVRLRASSVLAALLAVAVVGTWPVAEPARAADPRLEQAQQQQRSTQAALESILSKIQALEAEISAIEGELATLSQREDALRAEAHAASSAMASRVRESYKRGAADPVLSLFGSASVDEATEQARVLAVLARHDEGERQEAAAARTRTVATAAQVEEQRGELAARKDELARTKEQAAQHVAAAERQLRDVKATLAAEEAARERARREREARAAAASRAARARSAAAAAAGGGSAGGSGSAAAAPATAAPARATAPTGGGVACPVGNPRSYSDTWGAPRSGGRSHRGTDILAPRGTSIHAYESGTITRMGGNRLGGISLYLRGASGNEYYYTHLSGYVGGLSSGSAVTAGQQIAYNGDTGNAAGIPHLHFEVRPGGGGSVNPYPYVRRACG